MHKYKKMKKLFIKHSGVNAKQKRGKRDRIQAIALKTSLDLRVYIIFILAGIILKTNSC